MRNAIGIAAVVVMFGSVLYIRHLARKEGRRHEFLWSFGGNYRFYRDFWPELRAPVVLMGLSTMTLIIVACLR